MKAKTSKSAELAALLVAKVATEYDECIPLSRDRLFELKPDLALLIREMCENDTQLGTPEEQIENSLEKLVSGAGLFKSFRLQMKLDRRPKNKIQREKSAFTFQPNSRLAKNAEDVQDLVRILERIRKEWRPPLPATTTTSDEQRDHEEVITVDPADAGGLRPRKSRRSSFAERNEWIRSQKGSDAKIERLLKAKIDDLNSDCSNWTKVKANRIGQIRSQQPQPNTIL